jgi:hypothetical protein
MKAKFTIELEATKEEIDAFAQNINFFTQRNKNFSIDVLPSDGYVPRFYLPKRKGQMHFEQNTRTER